MQTGRSTHCNKPAGPRRCAQMRGPGNIPPHRGASATAAKQPPSLHFPRHAVCACAPCSAALHRTAADRGAHRARPRAACTPRARAHLAVCHGTEIACAQGTFHTTNSTQRAHPESARKPCSARRGSTCAHVLALLSAAPHAHLQRHHLVRALSRAPCSVTCARSVAPLIRHLPD